MQSDKVDDKLLKIIALAKFGIAGEKTMAIRMVKKICERENLDFDEVMGYDELAALHDYELKIHWKGADEEQLLAQVCFHFALTHQHPYLKFNKWRHVFMYKTTAAKHLETVNAATIYLRAYRKEKKKMAEIILAAFVNKNRLFADDEVSEDLARQLAELKSGDPEADAKALHDDIMDHAKKMQRAMMLESMMMGMDNVEIRKSIGGGNERR